MEATKKALRIKAADKKPAVSREQVTERNGTHGLPVNGQGLRMGYTTGSCAAAAAAAAADMLLGGGDVEQVRLMTPRGIELLLDIEHIVREEKRVRCGVQKYAGDDPDITDGIYVYAAAEPVQERGVHIVGGAGVGRVTRPGLDQPVGGAAINRVPRQMITQEVRRVMAAAGFEGGIRITVEIPGGEALAAKTFNPRLGIEGGISVLGTGGIVEPMSEEALKDTIRAELSVRRAEGKRDVVLVPGNYGLDFLRKQGRFAADEAVKCSNFIGDAIDMAGDLGFERLLLAGHIGKLIKLSGGIFQTHSRQSDARLELLAAAGIRAGVPGDTLLRLLESATTEDALAILDGERFLEPVMAVVKERIRFHLNARAARGMEARAIVFSNVYGEL